MNEEEKRKFLKALNLSYYYLKFRPRTKKEITDYLHKKKEKHKLTPEIIDKAVTSLADEGLINDKEFIGWFVKGRIKRRPKSEWVLKIELARLGIDKDMADQYFAANTLNEENLVYQALLSKWDRFKTLPKLERFKKSANYLLRRGFSYDLSKKAIKKLEEEVI